MGELIVTNKMQEFGYEVTPPKMYNDTWDKRIDGFETDIMLTKDKIWILFHDENLKRLTNILTLLMGLLWLTAHPTAFCYQQTARL